MKATQLLKKDHGAVKKLFAEFARTTSRAPRRRQQLVDKIAEELEIHSTIEEEIFYPAVKGVRGGKAW
jgi:hemerythrin superfamily protein